MKNTRHPRAGGGLEKRLFDLLHRTLSRCAKNQTCLGFPPARGNNKNSARRSLTDDRDAQSVRYDLSGRHAHKTPCAKTFCVQVKWAQTRTTALSVLNCTVSDCTKASCRMELTKNELNLTQVSEGILATLRRLTRGGGEMGKKTHNLTILPDFSRRIMRLSSKTAKATRI